MSNIKKIETEKAPKAIGPYSQAVLAGKYLFISGQIAIDTKTGKLVDGDIKEQTEQVIKNIEAILKSAGLDLDDVVKSEVYLTDLKGFKDMNEIYASRFRSKIKPARATVEVSKLPLGAKIEISAVAYVGD